MNCLQDDALRSRRARAAERPARVTAPLAGSATFVLVAIAAALLVGVAAPLVVLTAFTAATVAAVLTRRTLGSLIAGAGLRVVQPYAPGETVLVYVPADRRVLEAEVVRVGAANTTLRDGDRLVVVPNGAMLRRPPA